MADVWLPGWRRVDLGLHGGPYDDIRRPKALWHTTEGGSVAGARRAFAPYPPHLCYDPRNRDGEQYVPLNRHSYSLRGAESDDEYCLQIELVGYAGQAHTWPDEWLRNIAVDVIRPLRALAGVPDVVVWHGFLGEAEAGRRRITLASASSPIRLTDAQLREFAGHLGHQHAPRPDEHWDPGGLRIARAIELSHDEEDILAALTEAEQRELLDTVRKLKAGVALPNRSANIRGGFALPDGGKGDDHFGQSMNGAAEAADARVAAEKTLAGVSNLVDALVALNAKVDELAARPSLPGSGATAAEVADEFAARLAQ